MPLTRKLRENAANLVASLKKDLVELAIEKQVLDASPKNTANLNRLAVVEKEIRLAENGIARLKEYSPDAQFPAHCPYCWIIEGKRLPLNTVPGPAEVVSCWNCAAEYTLDRAD